MPYRKTPLAVGEIYHIYSKSIAGYKIFNSDGEFERMLKTIAFYTAEELPYKLSYFLEYEEKPKKINLFEFNYPKKLVSVLAYCLMPTHIHLILKQLKDGGISRYANIILKSYSAFFNTKHKRKGPLWERRFENVLVETDEQFLHKTRYVHLNPVTAYLVNDPKDWKYSSYREYIGLVEEGRRICDFSDYLDMDAASYEEFCKDQIGYQRELGRMKQ